ncbi:MAG TPA: hypothetical protein VMV03_09530 [Spirochaetia bacterium]|nr:hypothetical protein [Spirochaetia bacterium]
MEDNQRAAALPPIRRARGFRLYDSRGRRYLDLWREGGAALLGHRAGRVTTLMKSALSQGLAAGLPSVWEGRLLKMIHGMFPSFPAVRLFSSRHRALEAASWFLGIRIDDGDLYDPALGGPCAAGARAALWRPFLEEQDGPGTAAAPWDARLPALPLTVCGAPAPLCLCAEPPAGFPDGDHLPGFVLAGAARALADLAAAGESLRNVRVEKAVDGSSAWKRTGPYVRAAFDRAEYPRVFNAFLKEGVLLSPGYPGPSIIPGECSPGETRLLAELFAGVPGG